MNKTLIKDISVLEALVHSETPCTVSSLSKRLGLQPSNVHRTLQTWIALGFVTQSSQTGSYHCTLRLFEWGSKVLSGFNVQQIARPFLLELAQKTQETIHLSVLDGLDIVYLDKIDSPQPVRAYSEIGGRAPAHCVATGKALLAALGERALQQLPKSLPQSTRHTITSPNALRQAFATITSVGYAVNRDEWRDGVSGLGAVVQDHTGASVAAVGLSAPSTRMDDKRIAELALAVLDTAQQISRELRGAR